VKGVCSPLADVQIAEGREQGTLPALGECAPKRVFAKRFSFAGAPTSAPLLAGPSLRIRAKPPTRFSFPVSLQREIHVLKYLSDDNYLPAHRNKLPDHQRQSWTAESSGHLSAINI